MSTESSLRYKPKINVETKSSSYDRVNAILIAALLMFGFLFAVLFLIWVTSVVDFSGPAGIHVEITGDEQGEEKPKGEADDAEDPGVEEFPEVETPQLANALEAVADSVSSIQGALEKRSGSAKQMGKGSGFGSREGGGNGGDGIPEYKRWIINYSAADTDTYAKQLSFFSIDIGVVAEAKQSIKRLADPGGARRVISSDRKTEAKNIYFIHKKQRFLAWDRALAERAGIDTNAALTVLFYNDQTRQIIRVVEATKLQELGKTLADVKNTIFKVVPSGNGYQFEVTDIIYR